MRKDKDYSPCPPFFPPVGKPTASYNNKCNKKYRQHTKPIVKERQSLQEKLKEEKKLSRIAKALGRNRSSVTREYNRNRNKDGSYNWWRATILYMKRREKSVRKLQLKSAKVREFVEVGLKKYWSPQIITERYKKENPGEKLSHSTIYRAVRNKEFSDITPKTHLRRR